MVPVNLQDLGNIDYAAAFAVQERLASEIAAGASMETLLLREDEPIYTIGSGGRDENVIDPRVEAKRVNRGGDVTYHGPGQLVGYPLVDLGKRGRDLHRWLRFLEELLIAVAGDFGVNAARVDGRTGVWTARGKLASIGVGVRRWVTIHGFALNVTADLAGFTRINPCGIAGCDVTSLALETGTDIAVGDVKKAVTRRFAPLLQAWLPQRPHDCEFTSSSAEPGSAAFSAGR